MLRRIALLIVLLFARVAHAQERSIPEVYVTMQDNASLRAGPGVIWDRLAVLPYGSTYRATGRTLDGDWIQVAYAGELALNARTEFTVDGVTYGWVASWLLIWTGNILELPLDGVVTVPIARAAAPTIVLYPDEYMYIGVIDPSTRIQNPMTTPVTVEVTGRLGSAEGGFFWLQFKLGGQYYWTGSWAVGVPRGYLQLPDASYLYPYSRLVSLLSRNINRMRGTLSTIGGRWRALDAGRASTCNDIPDDFTLVGFSDTDLRLEPIFAPTAVALEEAQSNLNTVLAMFREACADTSRQISSETINTAMTYIVSVERNLNVVENLIAPLQRRDPILNSGG
jgi:hypothetical protein